MKILANHEGHRAWIIDANTIKCVDCVHILDVSPRQSSAGSSSGSETPSPRNLHDQTACAFHVGQPGNNCGLCRSEALEAKEARQSIRWGNNPVDLPAWQEARTRFGRKANP